jgi:hypothetical protein
MLLRIKVIPLEMTEALSFSPPYNQRRSGMAKDKKNSAFMRPVNVSEALADIVGQGPIARTEVTKRIWEYIKKHNLQNQHNKRTIKVSYGTCRKNNQSF